VGEKNPFAGFEETSRLSEFYSFVHTERENAKGPLLVEIPSDCPISSSVLESIAALLPSEVTRPMIMSYSEPSPARGGRGDVIEDFFEEILGTGMMKSVNDSVLTGFSAGSAVSSRTLLYLPNPRFFLLLFQYYLSLWTFANICSFSLDSHTNIEDFRNFGKFLMKCIIDGKPIPPLFAPSLFKYLVGKKPDMNDLEAFDPNLALRLRFSLAEDERPEEVDSKVS
jgi:hypothetical protein